MPGCTAQLLAEAAASTKTSVEAASCSRDQTLKQKPPRERPDIVLNSGGRRSQRRPRTICPAIARRRQAVRAALRRRSAKPPGLGRCATALRPRNNPDQHAREIEALLRRDHTVSNR